MCDVPSPFTNAFNLFAIIRFRFLDTRFTFHVGLSTYYLVDYIMKRIHITAT